MKVAVINTSVPFLRGGAEHLADSLVEELRRRDHQVELVKVPLRWSTPLDVASSMFAAASLRIPEADRVIPLKFPAFLVPHDNKVVWLLHQFRQAYDLWGTPLQDIPSTDEGRALRKAIRQADNAALGGARAIYCISSVISERLRRHNGLESKVLLHPHGQPELFRSGPYGDYILALGRITSAKRQAMVVEALAKSRSGIRLVIAGAPETAADLALVERKIDEHGLRSRVDLFAEYISDDQKVEMLAGARAVAYLPVDEDSYGYVTLEAMMSGRPVITCEDSGGVLALVEDGVTGIVAAPNAGSLARAMDLFADDDAVAMAQGSAGKKLVEDLGLSWDHVISRLLA
jgi:glycosyltransferase involved in cell wall biosynthesis